MGAALAVVVGVAGAWGALVLFGHRTVSMGPFQVEVSASFGRGITRISLPPLGELTANTHVAPIGFAATLHQVQLTQFTNDLTRVGVDGIVDEVERDAHHTARNFALELLGIGAAGGLLAGAVAFRLRWRLVVVAMVVGLVAVGGGEGLAWQTFRPAALLTPTFSGPLALAPKLIGPAQTALDRIDDVRAELSRVLAGAARVYASLQSNPVGAAGEIRVLHISDIHLSPLGMDFAKEIADAWDVDVVVDTGDITSFGTSVEELVLSKISTFSQRYLYVRGNHDSPEIEAAIRRIPNATVLDGAAVTAKGLEFYGAGDPVFTPDKGALRDDAQIAGAVRAVGPSIRAGILALGTRPDVLMVHDERMADAVAGYVPLVVSGHFHQEAARVLDGTLYLQVGSTGGAGANVFTEQGGVPLSAEVLYFSQDVPHRLVAYDVIEQSPESGSLTVKRHLVEQQFGPLAPSPAPSPSASATAGGTPTSAPTTTP